MSQILKSRSDGLTYLKTIRSEIGSRERFTGRLRLADQNSSQGDVLQRNVSSVYPKDLSADVLSDIFKFDNPSCPLKRIQ